MGPAVRGKSVPFRIFLDGAGAGTGTLDEQRTYQLIRQTGQIADRTFEVEFEDAGAEAYCFTFG